MSEVDLVKKWEIWQGVYYEEYEKLGELTDKEEVYSRDRSNWKAAIKVLGELIIESR